MQSPKPIEATRASTRGKSLEAQQVQKFRSRTSLAPLNGAFQGSLQEPSRKELHPLPTPIPNDGIPRPLDPILSVGGPRSPSRWVFFLGFAFTVSPIKLETGLWPNSAGIPYTLLLRIEAMGFPTFRLLLYVGCTLHPRKLEHQYPHAPNVSK